MALSRIDLGCLFSLADFSQDSVGYLSSIAFPNLMFYNWSYFVLIGISQGLAYVRDSLQRLLLIVASAPQNPSIPPLGGNVNNYAKVLFCLRILALESPT